MTLVENRDPLSPHVAELRLRRFRLGELAGPDHEDIARHTTDCGPCRARLKSLDDEQRSFEREIPFERFAGGVERARRVPRVYPRRVWTAAAGVLVVSNNSGFGSLVQQAVTVQANVNVGGGP